MRIAKIIGLLVGGLVSLAILTALLILLVVNPNDFKPEIIAAVRESTGRELSLHGYIKLSVFPWLALTLGPATLGNPPGFGAAPFLSFNRAEVRVKLLPLLWKHLEVAHVALDGLDLRLIKTPQGRANWQMSRAGGVQKGQPARSGAAPLSLQSIGGIEVTRGRVTYNQYVVETLHFETGASWGGRPVPVSLSLDAGRGIAGESLALRAKLDVRADSNGQDLHVTSLTVSGTLRRPAGTRLHCELSAPALEVDLDKQTLSLPQFSLGLDEAKLTGKLSGTQIVDDPHLIGSIALAPVNLRGVAADLGIVLPKTRDPGALSRLSAGAGFSDTAAAASLDGLELKLDDTTLKGDIRLSRAPAEALNFKLAADHIDLDRYRPPPGAAPAAAPSQSEAPSRPEAKAPADASAPLTAQGTFTLAAARAAGLAFTNLSVTVDMKDKVTHLHPLEAQLYGGRYSGDLSYDARTAVPAISMDEHLSNVDVTPLLASTKAKGRASGRANVDIKATAHGAAADDILKTLNGRFDASLANGALEGVDLGHELALAQALLDKQTGTSVPDTHRTAFDTFKDSAQITNGIAQTKDLVISSAVLKVTGEGTVDLPTGGLDMTLLASVMKSANRTAVDIPLKLTGTYTDPTVKPDLTALAKGELKQKALDALKKNGLDLNSLFKKK